MALRDPYATVSDEQDAVWHARHRMAAPEYEALLDEMVREGHRLRSLRGYEAERQDLYSATFERADGPEWKARHRMTAGDYQATLDRLAGEGWRVRHVSAYALGGQDLYAAIWERTDGPAWEARHRMTADEYQATSDRLAADGYRPSCLSACAVDNQDLYAALWEQVDGPAWQARHRLDAAGLEQVSETLARDGFQPVLITACS